MRDDEDIHPLDIPPFLKRDANNKAEFMDSVDQVPDEVKPAKKREPKAKADKPAKKAKPVKTSKPAKEAKTKSAKAAKPKTEKDMYGLRKGSSKSEAAAMYARKSGATLHEVKDKIGSIQLNVLNDLKEEGWVIECEKEERKGKRPVNRYWLKPKK